MTTRTNTCSLLLSLLLVVLVLNNIQSAFANCDVYKRTMDSIEYWHNYDFGSMDQAIQDLFAPDARVTMPGITATTTLSPAEYYRALDLNIRSLQINVRDIDCAFDGEWCHLKVFCTYTNAFGETVSIPQYWTYLYDPVTCKWAHYIVLLGSNDLEYMMDTLAPHQEDSEL